MTQNKDFKKLVRQHAKKTGKSYAAALLDFERSAPPASAPEPPNAGASASTTFGATAWRKTKLLIWGTTYPEFSRTYYETVCTGAIDEQTGRLVRIYPITLRYQKEPFHHYQWIEADIQRNTKDRRPESFRVQQEGIRNLTKLDTKDGWAKRSDWLLRPGTVFSSVEALWAAQEETGTSLGLVKPRRINRVYAKRLPESEREEWEVQRAQAMSQRDLFVDVEAETKDLVFMPVRYRVEFDCQGPDCRGHDMSVLDWGTYVLSRRQYALKGKSLAERDVIAKLEEITDLEKKDAYLFLGNTLAHPTSFMIVGFYYPPVGKPTRAQRPPSPQTTLPGLS